jgi:hypothetical protein
VTAALLRLYLERERRRGALRGRRHSGAARYCCSKTALVIRFEASDDATRSDRFPKEGRYELSIDYKIIK